MNGDFIILFLIGFPIIGAIVNYIIGKKSKKIRNYVADTIVIIEFFAIILLYNDVVVLNKTLTFQWNDFSGKGLTFVIDGFRFIYGSITAFMWMMTTIYSREYFRHYHNRNRYYFFSLITLGATMGVFLSADLFTTFIFFEMMSLASYVWVVHDEKRECLHAGETYLAVSMIGGLVMLMGIFLLDHTLGTLEMSMFLEIAASLEDKTMLYIAGVCLFVGFGAKAGTFPFHVWLPKAHCVAPAPVSALLSGILTKTGVFGVLVISCNLFFRDQAWGTFILVIGVITMFTGALLALFSINLKRTLACSSMSQIGFIMFGIGMQGLLGEFNGIAARGTFLHMVNHSLIKLVLFIVAGVVVVNIHQLDLNQIQGFGRNKKLLKFSFLMGSLGITGVPLWNGYVSKTLLHESIVEYIAFIEEGVITNLILPLEIMVSIEYIFLVSGGMTVAYMIKLYFCLFVQKNNDKLLQKKYDSLHKNYINKESRFVLVVSASILPIMGMLPTIIMDKLADISQGFMNGSQLAHEVNYFNSHNLGGIILTIGIGLFIYILFVYYYLMKKDETGKLIYFDAWPAWLDLEENIYRPFIIHVFPFIGVCIVRVMDDFVDNLVVLLRKTIYRDRKIPQERIEGNAFTERLGGIVDLFTDIKYKIFHTEKKREISYKHRFAVLRVKISENNTIIGRSLSFGLFMFCVGLCTTLIYMLFL